MAPSSSFAALISKPTMRISNLLVLALCLQATLLSLTTDALPDSKFAAASLRKSFEGLAVSNHHILFLFCSFPFLSFQILMIKNFLNLCRRRRRTPRRKTQSRGLSMRARRAMSSTPTRMWPRRTWPTRTRRAPMATSPSMPIHC